MSVDFNKGAKTRQCDNVVFFRYHWKWSAL